MKRKRDINQDMKWATLLALGNMAREQLVGNASIRIHARTLLMRSRLQSTGSTRLNTRAEVSGVGRIYIENLYILPRERGSVDGWKKWQCRR